MGCGCGQRRSPMAVTSANMVMPPEQDLRESVQNALNNAEGLTNDLTETAKQDTKNEK